MKAILFGIVFMFGGFVNTKAQSNLVFNPSFEQHYDTSFIGVASFLRHYVNNWSDPNIGSSDYFVPNSYNEYSTPPNSAFGFEYAHMGYAYGGFGFYDGPGSTAYEYVQASFVSPLVAGKSYAIECYVSLGFEGRVICISDLGFYFSDTLVSVDGGYVLLGPAQYENPPLDIINTYKGWQRITGNFTANGGEKYMSIGLFKYYLSAHVDTCTISPSYASTYLFIDDVAVYDTSKTDTIPLCMNDSVQIGATWQKTEGLYTDTIGGLPVNFYVSMRPNSSNLTTIFKPFENGDSVRISLIPSAGNDSLGRSWDNYLYLKNDTIIDIPMFNIYGCDSTVRYVCGWHIGIGNELVNNLSWSIYPNPANDFIEIQFSKNDLASYDILILDITGKEIYTQSIEESKIDIKALNGGLYFIKLKNKKTGNIIGVKKFVKE
jgi:hypothetical protein